MKSFCIYPFEEPFATRMREIVMPLVRNLLGYGAEDGTVYYVGGHFKMARIKEQILGSDLTITDISLSNPNVFLELGIGYANAKNSLLLCTEDAYSGIWENRFPFDISGREVLLYKDDEELRVKLPKALLDSVFSTELVSVGWVPRSGNGTRPPAVQGHNRLRFETGNTSGVAHSNAPVGSRFLASLRLSGLSSTRPDLLPDFRISISEHPEMFPMLVVILPWERRELGGDVECHINWSPGPGVDDGERLQQASTGVVNCPADYSITLALVESGLVVESNLFKGFSQLLVDRQTLIKKNFPLNCSYHLGFAASHSNCSVEIRELRVIGGEAT
jgi:hypothetical protein